MNQRSIEAIDRQAQAARRAGDYEKFWRLRRRYLLAQAAAYEGKRGQR